MSTPAERPGYFDALYAANPDPWDFETSAYERSKYDATLAALPAPHYRSALEVGCSIGVLTERLAPRCDALLAIDLAEAALERAAARCVNQPQVSFATSQLPDAAPRGPFDLIVLSEILYYFNRTSLARVARLLAQQSASPTDLLLVHWLGPTPDYPLTGNEAVACFEASLPDATIIHRAREPLYRLDVIRLAQAS